MAIRIEIIKTLLLLTILILLGIQIWDWADPYRLAAFAFILWILYLFKELIWEAIKSAFTPRYEYLFSASRKEREKTPWAFHGRQTEQHRLKRFLDSNPEGGAILVGGRRGSGKTRLVEEVLLPDRNFVNIERGPDIHYYKRVLLEKIENAPALLFFGLFLLCLPITLTWSGLRKRKPPKSPSRKLSISLPLIIPPLGKSSDDNKKHYPEQYRNLILQALAFALVHDVKYSKFARSALLLNFWTITRLKLQINQLRKFVHYTSVDDSTSTNFNIARKSVSLSAGKTVSGRLDISTAKLEMTLMTTFRLFTRADHKLIIVLDELDKLEADNGIQVEIADIMLYLKNLFSTSGVYTILIASHRQAMPFKDAITAKKDEPRLTLFRDVVMIESLDLLAFERLVKDKIKAIGDIKIEEEDMLTRLSHGLGIYTDYIPNELNRVFQRTFSRMDFIDDWLKRELGARYTPEMMLLRECVKYIYQSAEQEEHPDFNAIMYRLLCRASDNLLFGRVDHFSLNHIETVLYEGVDFEQDGNQVINSEQLMLDYTSQSRSVLGKPEAIKDFEAFSAFFRDIIRTALYRLAVFLERSGTIELQLTHPDQGVVRLAESSTTEKPILADWSEKAALAQNRHSPKEHGYINFINQLHIIFSGFIGDITPLADLMKNHQSLPIKLDKENDKVLVGQYGCEDFLMKWDLLYATTPEFYQIVANALVTKLGLTEYEFVAIEKLEDLEFEIKLLDKKIKLILMLSDKEYVPQEEGFYKIVVIQNGQTKKPLKATTKRRVFKITNGYLPVKECLDNLIIRIREAKTGSDLSGQ